jgi:RNA polymerase sigma-70 factor, ECF subfamily
MGGQADVSELLTRSRGGDPEALNVLTTLVFEQLRALAHRYMRRERRGHTLQTTALVNEAYLRLVRQETAWQNRDHFLGLAAQAMRRVLVDHARTRNAAKHGGRLVHVPADALDLLSPERCADVLRLDDALAELAVLDPMKHRIVELRYFGGLSVEETARLLGVAPITVGRHWRTARAWLKREVTRER